MVMSDKLYCAPLQSLALNNTRKRCKCLTPVFVSFCFVCIDYSQDKEGQNIKNIYNHNFFGRYCSCDRPYPDEDDKVCSEIIPSHLAL